MNAKHAETYNSIKATLSRETEKKKKSRNKKTRILELRLYIHVRAT